VIAIPTTAGTGSEVTPVAILSDEDEHLKKGMVSYRLIPAVAILDPGLTLGLPPRMTAYTGMDALTHAIEAYTSVNASDYSDALALRAVRLISSGIMTAFKDGSDLPSRGSMLMGSLLAGIAFACAGVAAVHAFAYPLGGTFHVAHGLSNSVMLPVIMEYNMQGNEKKFAELAVAMEGGEQKPSGARAAVDFVNRLSRDLGIPANLAALGIPEGALTELAGGAMKVTRLLANNPRKIGPGDAEKIYRAAYER
jgi:alcohol dehydrogenase